MCFWFLLCVYNIFVFVDIQELFTAIMTSLATRMGHKDVDDFVKEHFGGKVYDFTINYMGGHTLPHVDDPLGDGPGKYIYNLALQGAGVLYFSEQRQATMRDNAKAPSAVFHAPGDCLGFRGESRIYMKHGVLRLGDIATLPPKESTYTDLLDGTMRVVHIISLFPLLLLLLQSSSSCSPSFFFFLLLLLLLLLS